MNLWEWIKIAAIILFFVFMCLWTKRYCDSLPKSTGPKSQFEAWEKVRNEKFKNWTDDRREPNAR